MVYRQINKGKTIRKRTTRGSNIMFFALLGVLVATFVVVGCLLLTPSSDQNNEEPSIPQPEESAPEIPEKTEVEVKKIDFQSTVDEWAKTVNGNKSVLIYDLDRNEIAATYNDTEDYDTASLYKLFVVYEGYRRLESGEWKAEDPAGSTGYNILECLDLSIRESYSPCAETLWAKISHAELDEIIKNDFNIINSDISHLTSNVSDITEIMRLFYEHPNIKNEVFIARMKDSFLNQPKTTYDWRQGLPSGFSNRVNVYNKVGWEYNPDGRYWNIYHDAAIVEFLNENRHFIVVAMTNRVPYGRIKALGTAIEEKFYSE